MKRSLKLIIAGLILAVLFGACALPQVVIQPSQAAQPASTSTPDQSGLNMISTISVLQTQVASAAEKAVSTDAPTATVGAVNTQPAATTVVVGPTQTPTPAPTLASGTITLTPAVSSTPLTGTANVPCNRADFVTDVSIKDNTWLLGGSKFVKTWRFRNSGSCTWTSSYSLVFDHGYSFDAPLVVGLPADVVPGATVDLSVNMTAPYGSGVYQGFWKLQDANGVRFGIGAQAEREFWVKIVIGNIVTLTPVVYGGCELVSMSPAVNAKVNANEDMDIHWTVKNTRSTAWTTSAVDYKYISGTKMYKHGDAYDLPSEVASGGSIELIIDMITPSERGYYTMTWGVVEGTTRLCTMSTTVYVK